MHHVQGVSLRKWQVARCIFPECSSYLLYGIEVVISCYSFRHTLVLVYLGRCSREDTCGNSIQSAAVQSPESLAARKINWEETTPSNLNKWSSVGGKKKKLVPLISKKKKLGPLGINQDKSFHRSQVGGLLCLSAGKGLFALVGLKRIAVFFVLLSSTRAQDLVVQIQEPRYRA